LDLCDHKMSEGIDVCCVCRDDHVVWAGHCLGGGHAIDVCDSAGDLGGLSAIGLDEYKCLNHAPRVSDARSSLFARPQHRSVGHAPHLCGWEPWVRPLRLVAVGSEAEVGGKGAVVVSIDVEADALALPEKTEHGAIEASRFEENLGPVVVANDDTDPCCVVVCLDEPLHQTFSTLPALMHEVHTLARREFVPCLTRIF
jgi:hypothetical protein